MTRFLTTGKALFQSWLPGPDKDFFPPVKTRIPRHPLHWLTVIVLLALLCLYFGIWITNHTQLLFNPDFQNDDARTTLFPFHRYGPEGALADDPIANSMMMFMTPLCRLLYILTVPVFGLYYASKVIQALCFLIIFYSGYLVLRSRRGLAPAALLVFFMFHTSFIIDRIAGGLPRAFAFPLFALWTAGALVNSYRTRSAAALLSALLYPSAMLLILAAEGIYCLTEIDTPRILYKLGQQLKRYALIVAACFLLILPTTLQMQGRMHTLEEAKNEPAFTTRLEVLPFPDAANHAVKMLIMPFFEPVGTSPLPVFQEAYSALGSTSGLLIIALITMIPLLRLAPAPTMPLAFLLGSIFVYCIARVFAFHLYSPERGLTFGLPMASIMLVICSAGLIGVDKNGWRIAALRNLMAIVCISSVWIFVGDGIISNRGMTITRTPGEDLYEFAKRLPVNVRFAAHPYDADDLPYWAGRAATYGYETMQPWNIEIWRRTVIGLQDVLRMLYATDQKELLRICKNYNITHILVRKSRYEADFVKQATVIEPIGTYVIRLLAAKQLNDLLLARPNSQAVVFENEKFKVLEVDLLENAREGISTMENLRLNRALNNSVIQRILSHG